MKIALSALMLIVPVAPASAQGAGEVLRTQRLGGPVGGVTSAGGIFVNVRMGDVLYFAASDGITYGTGSELWRSDGTEAGTRMVKDIQPGKAPGGAVNLTAAEDRLYFSARTLAEGLELWTSDGTETGTRLVRDLTVGTADTIMERFATLGTRLLFRRSTTAAGMELWTSDGTTAGTVLLKDINPGTASSTPDNFVRAASWLYFSATTAGQGTELWRTDGTAAGTMPVRDILPGTGSSSPAQPVMHGGLVYFSAGNGTGTGGSGTELWCSDGTAGGTTMVKDLNPGTGSSNPGNFASAGGRLYFSADTDGLGQELFSTDGTAAGTQRIKDINPGSSSSYPRDFTAAAGTVFFVADVSIPGTSTGTGTELWKTDGTAAGTMLAADLLPGRSSSLPRDLTVYQGKLWFRAEFLTSSGHETGRELGYSDGTPEGTGMLLDLTPGTGDGAFYPGLREFNGRLFFAGSLLADTELWSTDGTVGGTGRVRDINRELNFTEGNILHTVVTAGSKLVFMAPEPATGLEYWSTDGTPEGTGLMKDIVPGPEGNHPVGSMTTGPDGLAYFAATEYLWRSDGTQAGTVPVLMNRIQASGTLSPAYLTSFGDLLWFGARYGTSGFDVVHRYQPATGNVGIVPGTRAGSSLYLSGNRLFLELSAGPNVWPPGEISSTTLNPVRMFALNEPAIAPFASGFSGAAQGRTIFAASSGGSPAALWVIPGPQETPHLLSAIIPKLSGIRGPDGVIGGRFSAPDGKVFFLADDGATGWEMAVSDGTVPGTRLLKDIQPGPLSSNFELKAEMGAFLGNRLVFTAETVSHGREVWITDGTTNGTFMLKDILPGSGTSGAAFFKAWEERVWFSADDRIHGEELWVTDGTPTGTVLAKDLNPGPRSSSPRFCQVADGGIYFRAGTRETARENIWQLKMAAVPSYAQWAAAAGLPVDKAGPRENPSGDGVSNWLKYAFNLDPGIPDRGEWTVGAAKGLPAITREGTPGQPRLTIQWLQRRGAALTYTPLLSNDAATWTPVTDPPSMIPLDDFWSLHSVTTAIPAGESARHFGAVRVTGASL